MFKLQLEISTEKPTPVSDDDIREFRRALWPKLLIGQLTLNAILLALYAAQGFEGKNWNDIFIMFNIPIPIVFLLTRSWLIRSYIQEPELIKIRQRFHAEKCARKAASAAKRGILSRTYFDEIGVVRVQPAVWTLVLMSSAALIATWRLGVFNAGMSHVTGAAALLIWMPSLSREGSLMQLAKAPELFPDHEEVQLLHRLGRLRVKKLVFPLLGSLSLSILACRYNRMAIAMVGMYGWMILFFLCCHWIRVEPEEQKHKRLTALALDQTSSVGQRLRRWWFVDWGVARPIVWVPSFIFLFTFGLLSGHIRFGNPISEDDFAFPIGSLWIFLIALNLWPAARWKMIAAREARP